MSLGGLEVDDDMFDISRQVWWLNFFCVLCERIKKDGEHFLFLRQQFIDVSLYDTFFGKETLERDRGFLYSA